MHALALPYREGAASWKYAGWNNWWLPVEEALAQLEPPPGSDAGGSSKGTST